MQVRMKAEDEEDRMRAGEMGKVLATKPDDLGSNPRTPVVEEKN